MARLETQERLAGARKRARERLAAERRVIEDQVLRYHRAALEIEDLTEQLKATEAARVEAIQALLDTGRNSSQVADLLGVAEAELGLGARRTIPTSARARPES